MTKTQSPAPYGVLGLEFGATSPSPYSASRPHGGQDHQWRYADPVRSKRVVAPVSGTVTTAFNDGGSHERWGNYVVITVNSRVKTRLAHHETGSVVVKVGQTVNAGDPIGTMGATGEADGVHLHEELLIDGVRVDPLPYRTKDLPGTPSTASEDAKPFPVAPNEEEEEMKFITIAGSPDIYIAVPGAGAPRVRNLEDKALLERFVEGKDLTFNKIQRDRLNAYLKGQTPAV